MPHPIPHETHPGTLSGTLHAAPSDVACAPPRRSSPVATAALLALFATLLLALTAPAARAQSGPLIEVDPQGIVVNPRPGFTAEVFVDRDRSGRHQPSYRIGEPIRVGVRVSADAYVYLFSIKANGDTTQILPNRFDDAGRDNFLRAERTRWFPPRDARYTFEVDGPRGVDTVFVVASREPLDTRTLARFERDPHFARSQIGTAGLADAMSIVVRPLPSHAWVTDAARFRVR